MSAFQAFKHKYGQPEACVSVTDSIIQDYITKLPETLLYEWATQGWCRYGQGLFWLVNPADYSDVLSLWISDSTQAYVIARTAFGCLIIWHENQAYLIDVLTGDVLPLLDSVEELFNDMLTDDGFVVNEFHVLDFEQAVMRLGVLDIDECYGYFPPQVMGGSGTSDTLQRVKLREYLYFLAELIRN